MSDKFDNDISWRHTSVWASTLWCTFGIPNTDSGETLTRLQLIQPQIVPFDLMKKSGGSKVLMAFFQSRGCEGLTSTSHLLLLIALCVEKFQEANQTHTLQIEMNPPKPWLNNPWKFTQKSHKSDSIGQRGLESVSRWLFHNNKDVSWRRTNRRGFDECSLSETCREVKSTEWVWEHDYFCVCRHSSQSRHLPSTPVQSHMAGAPRLPHCEPPSSAKPVFFMSFMGRKDK